MKSLYFLLLFPCMFYAMNSQKGPVYQVSFPRQVFRSDEFLNTLPAKNIEFTTESGQMVAGKVVCGRYELMPRPMLYTGNEASGKMDPGLVMSLYMSVDPKLIDKLHSHLGAREGNPLLFYFHGIAGTGKSETAKALAYYHNFPWYLTSHLELGNAWEMSYENNLEWFLRQFKNISHPHVIIFDQMSSYFASNKARRIEAMNLALQAVAGQKNLILIGIEDRQKYPLPEEIERQFLSVQFLRSQTAQAARDIVLAHNQDYTFGPDVTDEFWLKVGEQVKGKDGFLLAKLLDMANGFKRRRLLDSGRKNVYEEPILEDDLQQAINVLDNHLLYSEQ